MSRDNSEANLTQLDDSQLQDQMDDDSNDAPDNLQATDIAKGSRRLDIEEEQQIESEPVKQLMGIDKAILQSIERCGKL